MSGEAQAEQGARDVQEDAAAADQRVDEVSELDAYVFLSGADDGTINTLLGLQNELPQNVRFVTRLVGEYGALVCLAAGSLEELSSLVFGRIQQEAGRSTATAIAIPSPPQPSPKRVALQPVEAFIRLGVQPGRAEEVMEALTEQESTLGLSLVAGDYDILLEVGGDTIDVVGDAILALNGIPGIIRAGISFMVSPSHMVSPSQ